MNSEPKLLHAMLKNLADSIIEYSCYQIEAGAQVIQVSEQSKRAFWKARIRATTKLTLFHSITFVFAHSLFSPAPLKMRTISLRSATGIRLLGGPPFSPRLRQFRGPLPENDHRPDQEAAPGGSHDHVHQTFGRLARAHGCHRG